MFQPSADVPPIPNACYADLTPSQKAAIWTARARFRRANMTADERAECARIRQLRKAMRLSQTTFARQLGVTKRTVVRWETESGHLPSTESWEMFLRLEKANEEILNASRPLASNFLKTG